MGGGGLEPAAGTLRPNENRVPTGDSEIPRAVGRNLATRVPTGFRAASTTNLLICRENARQSPLKCLRAAELRREILDDP